MEGLKAINFDLDTIALKKYYTGRPQNAYRDIQRYLLANGFIHRQHSGYISQRKMHYLEVESLLEDMAEYYPWMKDCVRKLDVTEIGPQYDMLHIIQQDKKAVLDVKRTTEKIKWHRPPERGRSR